jgi:GrpB-like predicted nucleotidyltransferase (UPF0157 family)
MIEIVSYDPNWPIEFERLATTLRAALGDLALRIDHIGSTSVPDLASKDIIDIQVTVASFDAPLVQALASIGYTLRPDQTSDHRPPGAAGADNDWEKRYFWAPPGQRPTHLHVRIQGRPNQRYPLLFRDYLRAHPCVASSYAELKQRLARFLGDDRIAYTEAKDPACDIIVSSAEEWAQHTGWTP